MSISDARSKSIIQWLTNTLKLQVKSMEPASSDASFRRYFRVIHDNGQHIVMDAPPEKENTALFIQVATLFKQASLQVPDIIEQDLKQGFLLLEDFGSVSYFDHLNSENALTLYNHAFASLYQLQGFKPEAQSQLPCYDTALLNREIELFFDWFLEQSLALQTPTHCKENLSQLLISSALQQPQVCVHRDFHSRNLMVLEQNSPGILDFQDAVIGPISYDLVSLLRDCYITWPEHQVEQWMTLYFHKISDLGLINVNLETFTRWFDLMGLQRHLKAIGIFSRLHLRDNKSTYLADIPRTLAYVSQICKKYPELNEFNHFLNQTILPNYK